MAKQKTSFLVEPSQIVRGIIFNTLFESNCVALDSPDKYGVFLGRDSDNIDVIYSIDMVIGIDGQKAL